MFKLNPNPTFQCAVPISVAGLPEPLDLNLVFRRKSKTALEKWMSDAKGKDDAAILHEIILSWTVKDDADADVPYSLTALAEFLENYPAAHGELFRGYLRELTEAKRKN